MKSSKNLLEQLKPLPYFTKNTISQLGEQLGVEPSTVDTYISRFLKHRDIFRLKNGLYISADFLEKNRDDASYGYYLANVLRTPSYISSWAALQYYNLATESIRAVTCVTTKVTRDYQTKAGNFSYQTMNKNLFTGFTLVHGRFDFFIATPSKALFDMLYFKTRQFRGLREEDIVPLVEDLRIDIEEMSKEEIEKFYELIRVHL
jgi:predicted transcriptional regulator of viral defense system